MRTTLNLDGDVAAGVEALARERRLSLSRAANLLLRLGLRAELDRIPLPPYTPPTFDSGKPLLDVTDVAAALDALDRRR
jgi:hypothetical protein